MNSPWTNSQKTKRLKSLLARASTALLVGLTLTLFPNAGKSQETVSLSQYQTKAIPVANPIDLTSLPVGEVFQVNTTDFVIQFFFSGKTIIGIILKREKRLPIHIRWCFFRSCEQSPYDYKSVLAQSYQKPFNEDSFQVRLPIKFNYKFQGLHFTSGRPPLFLK